MTHIWILIPKSLVIAGILATGLVAAGCGTRPLTGGHTTARIDRRSTGIVHTITVSKPGDTFAPAPAGAKPTLTAQQAWAAFAHSSHASRSTIPRGLSVRLGLLTMRIGPVGPHGKMVYRAHNELAYGYSWHQCPKSAAPHGTLPPNPCIAWTFLNASNGQLIVITWQT